MADLAVGVLDALFLDRAECALVEVERLGAALDDQVGVSVWWPSGTGLTMSASAR